VSATAFSGPITGAVTGNVTGNLTGNVTGSVTGNVTGNLTGNVTGTTVNSTSIYGALYGNIVSSIAEVTLLKLVPELGYATGGSVALSLSSSSNAKIELSTNVTFALSGIASGQINMIALKNVTGGTITTSWPAWTSAGGSFPASLTAGQAMVVMLYSYGTTTASVYAVSSL
jgi:hypothetical protein